MKTKRLPWIAAAAIAGVALFATVAWAGERAASARRAHGLKAMGLKIYWSVLRQDQQAEAKAVIEDFLVETAPERLQVVAAWTSFRASVAGVLTPEQRRKAWALKRADRALTDVERRARVEALLETTDRGALADRVSRMPGATLEERAEVSSELLEQFYVALEADVAPRLDLDESQRAAVRTHFDALRADLKRVAPSLADARQAAIQKALAILDEDQRARVKTLGDDALARVLAFIRG